MLAIQNLCIVCEHSAQAQGRGNKCVPCSNRLANLKRQTNKVHRYRQFCRSTRQRHRDPLTYAQWHFFWQKPCEWCGAKVRTIGIDRIDNDGPYSFANCQSLCQVCNVIKGVQDNGRLLAHLAQIARNLPHIKPKAMSRFWLNWGVRPGRRSRALLFAPDDARFAFPVQADKRRVHSSP